MVRNRVFPAIIRSQSISCHCRSSRVIYHADTQTCTLKRLHSHKTRCTDLQHFHNTFLILMDKCYRTNEIHHGPFGTDLLAVGLDEYFIINGVGLYKYLPAVIILPYFIYDFNGGDSFYQIVTAVLYNAGKNKQL